MFSDHIETVITVFDSPKESLHRTIVNLIIISILKKTSLESIRDNIDDRMPTRLQDSIVKRLEHRSCTFWDTEEDDIASFDTSPATEGEIDEDIGVAL
jgi:hypothetical protein